MRFTANRNVALTAVATVGVLAGIGQGLLWAAIVPQQRWVVYAGSDKPLSLPTESTHRFTGIGMFALMSLVIGVCLGVAAWQIRFARGLPMLLAAGAGAGAGSAAALLIGPAVAGGVIPAEVAEAGVRQDTMVTMIPATSWTLVVLAPLAAVALYAFLAAWHPEPHLGNPPPAEPDPAPADEAIDGATADAITQPIPIGSPRAGR